MSWLMSGSAWVCPVGVSPPVPSPSLVQYLSTGAARSAASAPRPTAATYTAKVRARSAAHRGAWATPHARSSLSVVWPGSTYMNVAAWSTATGKLNAKERGVCGFPDGPDSRYGNVRRLEGRSVYAVEIEPAYVDVSVTRWEEFTGKKAVRQK